jgi:excisionase family DNA binding protein
MTAPRLMTVAEVADLYRVQPATVREACRRRRIPAVKRFGQWRIDATAVSGDLAFGPPAQSRQPRQSAEPTSRKAPRRVSGSSGRADRRQLEAAHLRVLARMREHAAGRSA